MSTGTDFTMSYGTGVPDHFNEYDQFFLFGDSITQASYDPQLGFGFGAALQHAYVRRLDVINRGLSGYNTANAMVIFPKIFPPPQKARIRLMTVFFGANDAALPHSIQHVPLDQYKQNLKALLEHPLTKAQNPKIIVITPPPINEYQLEITDFKKGIVGPPRRTAKTTKMYADACRDVAKSLGIPVADLWAAFMNAAQWKPGQPLAGSKESPVNERLASLLSDGLHFTSSGYKIMFDEVMNVLRATWPEEDPEKLPMIFPPWEVAPK
ncbi:GDSL Lipase/Acylhydrolase family protein [Talaromyces proteolyticus]|uniref:GDSL Lipase/Acylhydrolase family protein n=1 Tax=Talaromyces proteolyticus TaxID=1131652 RepID=A0AAD4PX65_9EURO|nr:GDSL Lipase/Acylhydrolase family protein [Talaromyces proteolyticus]KAH8696064.1 GDSL Lipase/Acylhydrolase family protein [Talaromyces proteolyticus]